MRYIEAPLVILTMLSGGLILFGQYGLALQVPSGLALIAGLLLLSAVDLEERRLPDRLTLGLLWLGLAVNLTGLFTRLESAVLGAMLGYGMVIAVSLVHRKRTGREGIGRGDAKCLAALGAWVGWQLVPVVLLAAVLIQTPWLLVRMKLHGMSSQEPVPFGPALAVAGGLTLLIGPDLPVWVRGGP